MESRDPITDIDYSSTYNKTFLEKSDGIQNLDNKHIKFGDALAAISYAYDIDYDTMLEHFPEVKHHERYHGDKYSVQDQMDFVKQHAKRTPKNVLEIGAGRGEVTLFLTAMGCNVTAIEPSKDFVDVITDTAQKLYPTTELANYEYINKPIHQSDIDYSKYDTIMMVESLEHILAKDFDPEWENINNNFKGYFIIVNWKRYHPIAVGQYASREVHCRVVNDSLYNTYCEGHTTKVRDKSHLCVEL